jgi:hypothetical protein
VIFDHVDESLLLSFSCSDFVMDLICVQTCLSTTIVVAVGCGPVASLRIGKRLGSPPH